MTEKDHQIHSLLDSLEEAEKQVRELTEEQGRRDHQCHQSIGSLNKLLKDTEELTQQEIDLVKVELLETKMARTSAEYVTAELKSEYEQCRTS